MGYPKSELKKTFGSWQHKTSVPHFYGPPLPMVYPLGYDSML